MVGQARGPPYLVSLTGAAQLPLLRTTRATRHDDCGCCTRARKDHVRCEAVMTGLRTLDQLAVPDELVPEAPVALRKRRRPISPRRRTRQHDEAVVHLA